MSIAIRKNKNIKQAISEVLAEIKFVPGRRVYVKPNLSGREPVLPGENTSVEVTDALIDVLSELGCSEIIIGHGALLGSFDQSTPYEETLRSSGFDKYLQDRRVKIVNLDEMERTEIKIDEMTFHLPIKFLESVDSYINLAKIKTHMEATVSFSLKNQMGFPSPIDRVMMHKTDLERTIAKLALYCKPHLSILEGFPAMEKNGPHHGVPKNLELIIAGDDMVELDSFASYLFMFEPEKIPHIKYASELGIGKIFPQSELGKYKEFFVPDFRPASKSYQFGLRLYGIPTYSCSRCITAVNQAGKSFKKHPIKYWKVILASLFAKKKTNIVFGRADALPFNGSEKYICIGNCTKNFAIRNNQDYLDKCPPGVDEARDYIVDKLK